MNITPHINHLPVATSVNPPTDNLRRENFERPVITAPTQTSGSPAEKSTTDKDKASGQTGEQFNFTELQKSAEKNANQINGSSQERNSEQNSSEQNNQENTDQNTEQSANAQSNAKGESVDPNSAEAAQHAQEILQLKQRDQEVRAHELAHASVGGASTGAPSYEFQIGPDGKKYAVGGEVSVDLSTVEGDPQATIAKMEKVHAAALAPANPSAQDNRVAAQASEIIIQAQADLSDLSLAESERKNQPNKVSPYIGSNDTFHGDDKSTMQSQSYDEQMNGTLKSQEAIAPTIPGEIKERSQRIEGYYSGITQAYEKAPSHQFELTA